MARTIKEIQNEIIAKKESTVELQSLNSDSKSAIWRLWAYIVATAIWAHERIVEKNALNSRPHTLNWYREQALNYIYGSQLIWEDGYFQFDEDQIQESDKIIKHCAVSERLFDEVQKSLKAKGVPIGNVEQLISEYYYNQVGIIRMKVATEDDQGIIKRLDEGQLTSFEYYMNEIKNAGNQLFIESLDGDRIHIELEVYVDPLVVYVDEENPDNPENGKSLKDFATFPVEDAIKEYVETLEFNGAIVPTYLVDRIQEALGTRLVLLRRLEIATSTERFNHEILSQDVVALPDTLELESVVLVDDSDSKLDGAFYVPAAGYFNYQDSKISLTYKPYNLQTSNNF